MKRIGKNFFEVDIPLEESEKLAKRFAKTELLILRCGKERKKQIKARANGAGVSMSAYLLMAEDHYAKTVGTASEAKKRSRRARPVST